MNNYTARMIFPTIIHEYLYDKFDEKEAIDFCYKQRELDPQGKVISNRGGWHSSFFNVTDDNIISHTLGEGFGKSIFTSLDPSLKLSITYWIMINSPNSYNTSHNPFSHTGYAETLSYLDEVKDQTAFYHSMFFTPKVGKMLSFPSALRHEVLLNESDEDRISISYNINILK